MAHRQHASSAHKLEAIMLARPNPACAGEGGLAHRIPHVLEKEGLPTSSGTRRIQTVGQGKRSQ